MIGDSDIDAFQDYISIYGTGENLSATESTQGMNYLFGKLSTKTIIELFEVIPQQCFNAGLIKSDNSQFIDNHCIYVPDDSKQALEWLVNQSIREHWVRGQWMRKILKIERTLTNNELDQYPNKGARVWAELFLFEQKMYQALLDHIKASDTFLDFQLWLKNIDCWQFLWWMDKKDLFLLRIKNLFMPKEEISKAKILKEDCQLNNDCRDYISGIKDLNPPEDYKHYSWEHAIWTMLFNVAKEDPEFDRLYYSHWDKLKSQCRTSIKNSSSMQFAYLDENYKLQWTGKSKQPLKKRKRAKGFKKYKT